MKNRTAREQAREVLGLKIERGAEGTAKPASSESSMIANAGDNEAPLETLRRFMENALAEAERKGIKPDDAAAASHMYVLIGNFLRNQVVPKYGTEEWYLRPILNELLQKVLRSGSLK